MRVEFRLSRTYKSLTRSITFTKCILSSVWWNYSTDQILYKSAENETNKKCFAFYCTITFMVYYCVFLLPFQVFEYLMKSNIFLLVFYFIFFAFLYCMCARFTLPHFIFFNYSFHAWRLIVTNPFVTQFFLFNFFTDPHKKLTSTQAHI